MPILGGDILYRIRADMKAVMAGMAATGTQLNKLGASFMKHSRAIGIGMTAAGAAISVSLGGAVKSAISFGTEMAAVNTLGIKDLGGLGDAVKDVATDFGLDLADGAKAAYQAISAGASEAEVPLLLAEAAKAATAGQSDLTTAIELGTGITNAYGKEIKDVSKIYDAAFVAVKSGVTTFNELGASVGKVAPAFKAAGLSSDEMLGSIAALTLGNIQTSEAVTGLKAILAGFTRQGEDSRLQTLGFAGALEWLKEQTGGSSTEMLAFLGSTEALNAALVLTGAGAADYADIMEEMEEKIGKSQKAFEDFEKSDPATPWRKLKAELVAIRLEIGEALIPTMEKIAVVGEKQAEGFRKWIQENQALTAQATISIGVIGALASIFGVFLIALKPIAAGFVLFKAGIVGAVAGLTGGAGLIAGLMGPGGLALALVATTELIFAAARAYEDLQVATGQMTEAEKRLADGQRLLQRQLKDTIDHLEEQGVAVDRVALANLTLEQKIKVLQKAQRGHIQTLKLEKLHSLDWRDSTVFAIDALTDLGEVTKKTQLPLVGYAATIQKNREAALDYMGATIDLIEVKEEEKELTEEEKQSLERLNAELEKAQKADEALTIQVAELEAAQKALSAELKTATQQNIDLAGGVNEATTAETELADQLGVTISEARRVIDTMSAATRSHGIYAEATWWAASAQRELNRQMSNAPTGGPGFDPSTIGPIPGLGGAGARTAGGAEGGGAGGGNNITLNVNVPSMTVSGPGDIDQISQALFARIVTELRFAGVLV